MSTLLNFMAFAAVFNILFFMYAGTKMKNKLHPFKTTLLSIFMNVPLSLLLCLMYTSMLVYAASIGANEEWIWEYMEQGEAGE